MSVGITRFTAEDADDIDAMCGEFVSYLRDLGDPESDIQRFTKEKYLEDGFGSDPAFSGYIARLDGKALGYLLYTKGYNIEFAIRLYYICDLWVRKDARRLGVARLLMERAKADCLAEGGHRLKWDVWLKNPTAFDFYRRIGGVEEDDLVLMKLDF